MSRNYGWWQLITCCCCIVAIYITCNVWMNHGDSSSGLRKHTEIRRCDWKPGDLVIYHLRTKLGVNYDAGHWFHMAENFMVQHSVLREARQLTNESNIMYSFDKPHFIADLNGITRLLVYLGTKSPVSPAHKLYFSHFSLIPWSVTTRPGSDIVIDYKSVDELLTVDLSLNFPTKQRFSQAQKSNYWIVDSVETAVIPSERSAAAVASLTAAHSTRFLSHGKVTSNNIDTLDHSVSVRSDNFSSISSHNNNWSRAMSSSSSSSSNSLTDNAAVAAATSVCAKYMGTIGGSWPTAQRGHWFPNEGDIISFRQSLRTACPFDDTLLKATAKKKPYKMIIYQRDLSRKLANEIEAVSQLQQSLGEEWEIQVLMHSTSRSPCELMHHLYNTDLLVTPHGFQSMLLLFLPRPALIFEIFPYKYCKRGYGPFGNEYGVSHSGVMSPGMTWHTRLLLRYISTSSCMLNKYCRNYARNQDVKLTMHGVKRLVAFVHNKINSIQVQPLLRTSTTSGAIGNTDNVDVAWQRNLNGTHENTVKSMNPKNFINRDFLYN